MSAPPRFTSSACTICSCRPAAERFRKRNGASKPACSTSAAGDGLYAEDPHGVEISRGRALPRAHHHPQPGAGRHLHRRDLPDRPRPGARRRHPRHRDQQVGVRALRRARRAASTRFSTASPPSCSRSASAGRPPRSSAAASERRSSGFQMRPKPILTAFGYLQSRIQTVWRTTST